MSLVKTNVPDFLYVLPDEYEVPVRDRSNNNVPDVDSLTPAQREVYNTIVSYLEGKLPDVSMIALKGYAGTGKTYVISQVLKWYVLMMQNDIAMTAPTNKAVKVLKNTAGFVHPLITFATVHKLYGLKEKINEVTGARTFEPEWGVEVKIDDTQALIVDETSMLPDSIFALIKKSNERMARQRDNRVLEVGPTNIDDILKRASGDKTYETNLKVVFLGDPIQIPPVGKKDCIPFNEADAYQHNILTLELTEIIRQKEGNPILDVATTVRENYKKSSLPYVRETKITDQGGVVFINAKDKNIIYRICDVYFSNIRFQKDSDFMKVIAWTNRTVNFMNDKIRSYVYKEKLAAMQKDDPNAILPALLNGEKLIADSPIVEDLGYKIVTQFNTNDEFEVISYVIESAKVYENFDVNIYSARVKYVEYSTGRSEVKTIRIVHEDSIEKFNKLVLNLKNIAIKSPATSRGSAWKFYYLTESKFARVKYNYAITAHKAQGSTYDNTLVITADIDANPKIEERNRIKYVAYTRAKQHLFIVE